MCLLLAMNHDCEEFLSDISTWCTGTGPFIKLQVINLAISQKFNSTNFKLSFPGPCGFFVKIVESVRS